MKDSCTSHHKIKTNLPHWDELEILWNGALQLNVSVKIAMSITLAMTF